MNENRTHWRLASKFIGDVASDPRIEVSSLLLPNWAKIVIEANEYTRFEILNKPLIDGRCTVEM